MKKKWLLASAAIFVAWSVMDFILHGLILASTYEATAQLWRPMAEMNQGLMHGVTAVCALAFTGIYAALVSPKSVGAGLKYGLLFGIVSGMSMGFGSYSYMPIPIHLAAAWFLGSVVEIAVAGLMAGAMIREAAPR